MKGFRWRVMRAALGLRQSDIAARAQISQARYSLLEREEATPTEGEVRAIETALYLPKETAHALSKIAGMTRRGPLRVGQAKPEASVTR